MVGRSSLVKTLDEFILPFVLLVAARYLGFFIAIFIAPIQFEFSLKSDLMSAPFVHFIKIDDLFLANSVSWLFTAAILGIVFGFVAFRSLHLNEDWLHPKETAAFHKKNMSHLLVSGEEATHQVIAWSLATLLALNFSVVDLWLGNLSTLMFGIVVSVSALLTVLYILSLTREVGSR